MNILWRNSGLPLDLDWVLSVQANTPAIERRCKKLPGRHSIEKNHQAAWLLKALSRIDLTTQSGDDTEQRVLRLYRKARIPVRCDPPLFGKHQVSVVRILRPPKTVTR